MVLVRADLSAAAASALPRTAPGKERRKDPSKASPPPSPETETMSSLAHLSASRAPSTSNGHTTSKQDLVRAGRSTRTPARRPMAASGADIIGTGTPKISSMDNSLKAMDHPRIILYHFNCLKTFVGDLDIRMLMQFIDQICDPNNICSLSAADTLIVFETAAEVHGCKIVPHISRIVSTIIRIMSSVTGSLHSVGCSKVICAISRYSIDPLGTEQEKSGTISSLCSPLSGCLMSTNECVSTGSALCVTALIQSNNWQFASHELINDICLKVSGALEEVHCQTISHLDLVVALLKQNRLALEPYGRSLVRSGLSILGASTKEDNSQMIMSSIQMIHAIMKNSYLNIISSEISSIIKAMQQLQDCIPEIRTDACQVAEIATELCNQILMVGHASADISMHPCPNKQLMSTPEESPLAQSSSASRPKSERRYSDNQSPSSSSGPPPLRRKLNFGEELTAYHHSLFRCSLDSSDWISLRDYAIDNRETLVQKISTPGTDNGHTSETAENELKLVVRRSYHLLDNLHECGLTLNGNLSAKNILIDKYRNVKFDETAKEAVKKLEDEGGDAKDEDKHAFVHMIKREVFDMKPVPSDLGTWLFLVDSCDKSIEEALKYNINLMDEHQMSSTFTSLFDTLLEMEKNDSKAYDAVITELKENPCYANWQLFVNDTSGNRYLRDTFKYRILNKKKRYKNNPRGLLLMLRNSRQHSAKFKESEFARIVAEHFPKLLSDFQLAMHRQKCLQKLNLKYSMG